MILEHLIGAATPENPSFNLNSERDWENFLSGPPSASGVRINRDTALTYSPFWRGVNLLARDTARLPLHNYRRKANGGRERNKEHSSYRVILRKANRYQTAFHLKLQLTAHAIAGGNGYGYIYRRGNGTILPPEEDGGIVPLDPASTLPVRETIGNQSRVWYVTKVNGENRKLSPENVLHIKGLGYDGLVGYDVIQLARDPLGLGKAQERYRSKFFSNGAHLQIVLEAPGVIGPKQAQDILDSWGRIQGGLDNSHKTAVLHSGIKANALNNTARESQLAEGVELSIRDAANILGIPPHKLGAKTGESYASKEQENLDYLLQALDFWLVVWESECHEKLLTEDEKQDESAYFEFAREKLFETDLKTKAEYFTTGLAGKPWHTQNEARLAFNLEPIEGYDDLADPESKPEPEDDADKTEFDDEGNPVVKPSKGKASKAAAASGNVQATALNGAQMQGSLTTVLSAASKEIPTQTAKALLKMSFPLTEETVIDDVITPLETFEAEPTDEPLEDEAAQEEDDAEQPRAAAPINDKLKAALTEQLKERVGYIVRRIGQHAERAAKDADKFMAWLDGFPGDQLTVITEAVAHAEAACNALTGSEAEPRLAGAIIMSVRSGLLEWSGTVTAAQLAEKLPEQIKSLDEQLQKAAVETLLGE